MADENKPVNPSAPPTGANPAAPVAHAARPAAPPKPAPVIPDLAGKTTTGASAGAQAAARTMTPAAATAATRDPDDTSPLLTRRAWLGLAWGAFSAASAAALAATGRFMFPNVLNEPPQQFKAGFPNEYGVGVDERWKEKYAIWLVRTAEDIEHHASGFYALISVCTHLGCTPNYLSAENKFKCPCHGSGFRTTGVNFEGPAPRPLERARIVLADDGQILVDKSRKFQRELGQWADPEAFLKG
jgi:cytochrome b6-f complex iron-sulfur subunit